MSVGLSLPAEKIFSSSGCDLKITKAAHPPWLLKEGEFTLSRTKALKNYEMKISNGSKVKVVKFKPDTCTAKFRSREKQFTITIYINQQPNILCGTLMDEDSTNNLLRIMSDLFDSQAKSGNTGNSSENPVWLSKKTIHDNRASSTSPKTPNVKENNYSNANGNINSTSKNASNNTGNECLSHAHTRVTKTYSKIKPVNRQPLKQVGGSNGNSTFPSPSSFQNSFYGSTAKNKLGDSSNGGIFPRPSSFQNLANGNIGTENDDCKITAVGAHKTPHKASNFYTKAKRKIEGLLTFRKPGKTVQSPAQTVSKQNDEVVGFANLGNTCYMNAILQCLLNIPNFYQELRNKNNISLVDHESLYNRLCSLGYMKQFQESTQNHKAALQLVKTAISSAAKRFSGYAQHDAHEFLCQCLDQLKEDLLAKKKISSDANTDDENHLYVCPIKDNFESTIVHSIKCLTCNEEIVKEETCHDFSLVIPDNDENSVPNGLEINRLLQLYFTNELIDYTCDKCNGDQSVLSHRFQKLPRVLILHLKRYDMFHTKRSDQIHISNTLSIHENLILDQLDTSPKNFVFEPGSNNNNNNQSTGTKRKLSHSSLEHNMPNAKTPKQSSTSTNSFKNMNSVGELSVMGARDNHRGEALRKQKNEYTKIQDTRRELDFTSTRTIGNSTSDIDGTDTFPKPFASAPDYEEEELQRVLELSMREFEEQQRSDMDQFSACQPNGEASSPTKPENTRDKNGTLKQSPFLANNNNNIVDLSTDLSDSNVASVYKLVGVVNHHGLNTQSGHYTCDCYDFKSKQWRNYDDSSVKDVTDDVVNSFRSKSGYIVFYMHSSCYNSIASRYDSRC